MADVRSVVVRLSAETSSYIAKMQQAGVVTEASMDKSTKASKKASVGLSDVEKAGAGMAIVIAGKAVLASADFEQAMSNVEAATHGSVAEMGSLEQAALDAGKATSFSATEAAAGIENLAKAGVSTADILGGALTGSLDLAAAGTISVADAAEYTATALTQFQLDGSQAAHVADLLAAGAGKAQGEVSDMALALNYAGVPAANLGVSIEETAGSIALLAKNGIVGEKAGTALRGMLGSLGSPSKIAAKEMQNLGINVFDAQGKFIGFEGVAGQLQDRLAGLTQEEREQALGRIFGNEQAAAAGVFFREGAAGVAEMTKAVDDNGYAAETASIKMDNLKGDVEVLMGSIETALIGSGDSSQDSLRTTTQLLTELVDGMSAVNEQSAIGGAVDQLSVVNSDVFKIGLSNLQKTQDALFGVDEATKDVDKAAADAADSALAKADADKLAAAEATRLGSAAKFSEEELKAQADALEDARKAATDTAHEFSNLGDSLDDSKVSLTNWIREMEEQADALRNFRLNAEQAADKGLRKGLIAALQDAGPEGALRMKQLANATKEEIGKANQAWQSNQREIGKYVNAVTKLPPVKLKVDDVDAARKLAAFKNSLEALKDRNLTITTVYRRVNSSTDALPARASGGQVFGPGTTTSDSILARLSNKEYVVQAAAVDHYGVGFFDAANAMRLAGGGSTDKNRRKNVGVDNNPEDPAAEAREHRKEAREEAAAQKQAERDRQADKRADAAEQDRQRLSAMEEDAIEAQEEAARRQQEIADAVLDGQERAWDMATDAAKAQVDAAQSLVDSVQANMDRIGAAATAAFEGDLFSQGTQQHGLSSGPGGGGSAGDWRARAMEDISGLQERQGLIAQLSDPNLGLSPAALEALLSQSDNAGIKDLLAKGEVDDYAALFAQREALIGQVSTQAGMAGYGEQYAAASAQLVQTNERLARIEAAIVAARPITVLEAISAAATAAEIARLEANY